MNDIITHYRSGIESGFIKSAGLPSDIYNVAKRTMKYGLGKIESGIKNLSDTRAAASTVRKAGNMAKYEREAAEMANLAKSNPEMHHRINRMNTAKNIAIGGGLAVAAGAGYKKYFKGTETDPNYPIYV